MNRNSPGILIVILLLSLTLVGCLFSVPGISGTLRIQGTVVDEGNVGIGRAAVLVDSEIIGLTAPDGTWAYAHAKKGAKITVQKAGWDFEPESITVAKDEQMLWIVGTRQESDSYSVDGKVVDGQGIGIPNVTITYAGSSSGKMFTDPQGNFTLSNLIGSVKITAAKPGYEIKDSYDVNGPKSDIIFIATESASATYTVSGEVLSGGGLPIARAIISLRDEVGRVQTVLSGSDGSFSKADLVGKLTATISLEGWEFTPVTRIVDGENSSLNFYGTPSMETAYEASGAILISDSGAANDGQPLAAVLVRFELLDFADSEDFSTITTPEGVWMMDGLLGRVKITPEKDGYSFTPEYQIIDKGMQYVGFVAR